MDRPKLTPNEIEVRIWAFVVVAITMILAGIVFSLLYSVTFVTQPIKSMAPIDQAYTKMLNDIVLLIVGGIGGIVGKRVAGSVANSLSPPPPPPPAPCPQYGYVPAPSPAPTPLTSASAMPNWNWMGYQNPELDESWTPGPPPTTPPDALEPDDFREQLATARSEQC